MAEQSQLEAVARMPIVLAVPGMDAVAVRTNVPFAGADPIRAMDVYSPPEPGGPRPAVVFVFGYPQPMFAQGLKEMGCYRTWGRLLAASGLAAVTYRYVDPVADLAALLAHLRVRGPELGIDPDRVAIWSASGNVPVALGAAVEQARAGHPFRAAALFYPYTLDGEGGEVTAAQKVFGFAMPAARMGVADLPAGLPLLVARAGKDETPGLNTALDRFIGAALGRNLPLTVVNHPAGPHAFDVFDASDRSREVIRAAVAWLRERC